MILFIFLAIVICVCGCGAEKVSKEDDAFQPKQITMQKEVVEKEVKMPESNVIDAVALRRNPFLSKEEENKYSQEVREIITSLNLSAVFHSQDYSYAVINGRVIKTADIVDNKEVVKIEPEKVVLRDDHGEYVVNLSD
ncbi:MAG: hypothetical protein GY858_01850 [Candidatus Omnitrophica bacterium]|nr:hypothetical protein [Candidatus Omnitrophota bacterium]